MLRDLHELLQHFEENHVRLESDDSDDQLFECEMDVASQLQQVCLADISTRPDPHSAFDTSVVRRRPLKTRKLSADNIPVMLPPHDSPPPATPITAPPTPTPSQQVTENKEDRDDRPYRCKVAGCAKAYKNPGGLKYHMQHGHCQDTGDPEMNNIIHKPYQCTVPDCQKRYKNLNGLKVFLVDKVPY